MINIFWNSVQILFCEIIATLMLHKLCYYFSERYQMNIAYLYCVELHAVCVQSVLKTRFIVIWSQIPCLQWHAWQYLHVNTLGPDQNGYHSANGIFKCMFLKKHSYFGINLIKVCSLRSSWQINISSSNGCKAPAKPLHKPIVTNMSDAILHHWATISVNSWHDGYHIWSCRAKIYWA